MMVAMLERLPEGARTPAGVARVALEEATR